MTVDCETALAVPVPAAEAVVGPWRARLDPASVAAGVPAHVTLIYPFRPPELLDDALRHDLRGLFSSAPAFDVTFAGVCAFPDVLYLAPEPSAPFDALIAGLVEAYPDTPPYRGRIADVVPHLTIGATFTGEDVARVCAEVEAAYRAAALPIHARVDSVALMECDEEGRWRIIATFPLAPTG